MVQLEEIEPILKFAYIFGISPVYNLNGMEKSAATLYDRLWSSFLIILGLVTELYLYATNQADVPYFSQRSTYSSTTKFLFSIAISVSSVFLTINAFIIFPQRMGEFLRKCAIIESRFPAKFKSKDLKLKTIMVWAHIFVLLRFGMDTNASRLVVGFIKNLRLYQQLIMLLMFYAILSLIKDYFFTINQMLRSFVRIEINERSIEFMTNPTCTIEKAKRVSMGYENLMQQIDSFNHIFKLPMVLAYCAVATGLTDILLFMIRETRVLKLLSGSGRAVLHLATAFVLATCCHQTNQEARVTSRLCHKIRLSFHPIIKHPQQELLQEELEFLANLSSDYCPNMILDYGMMISLFSGVISYVIVDLQLN